MFKAIFLDGLGGNDDGLDGDPPASEFKKTGEGGYLDSQPLVEAQFGVHGVEIVEFQSRFNTLDDGIGV